MSPLDFLLKHKQYLENRISTFSECIAQAENELGVVRQLITKEKEADDNPPQ
ncbi:MAG TPA: hypothetical protein GXX75_04670 [Clostridiales bacterium]|nr:hypothetical protein [Clostridiales bacterium]